MVVLNNKLQNRNPYIMVLIDGDGLIVRSKLYIFLVEAQILKLKSWQFHEDLIRQGVEGGKKAANALRNAVLEQCSDLSEDTEVICKICANVSGLGKAMIRDGSLDNPDQLRDFTLGFTQGKLEVIKISFVN